MRIVVRGQRSEVRDRTTEVRGQTSEVRNQAQMSASDALAVGRLGIESKSADRLHIRSADAFFETIVCSPVRLWSSAPGLPPDFQEQQQSTTQTREQHGTGFGNIADNIVRNCCACHIGTRLTGQRHPHRTIISFGTHLRYQDRVGRHRQACVGQSVRWIGWRNVRIKDYHGKIRACGAEESHQIRRIR